MDNKFIREYRVSSTQIDHRAQMGMVQVLGVNQDNFCEYFKVLGCDGLTMIPLAQCFFVTTKTRFKIQKSIDWLDDIVVESTISKKSVARIECDCNILDKDGNICACGRQELCPMDSETRRLRMVNTTLFPKDIIPSAINDVELNRLNFDDANNHKIVEVEYSNIDFFGHTNNVEYVKIMLNVLPIDFIKSIHIYDCEIHYIHESRVGDHLDIGYSILDGEIQFVVRNGDAIITRARLLYNR